MEAFADKKLPLFHINENKKLDVCCKYEAIFTVKQPIVFLHC
jgi:hypothetical protein